MRLASAVLPKLPSTRAFSPARAILLTAGAAPPLRLFIRFH